MLAHTGENSLRDYVQPTFPQKKHGLSTNFLVEKLLNACPESLAIEKPLTGFSESQEQIVDAEISSESEMDQLHDSLESDFVPFAETSSEQKSEDEEENSIVELFKKKYLDTDTFPNMVKRLSEMKEFFRSDLNFKRRLSKMSDVTWSKTLERLVLFLSYCSHTLKLDVRLELVENMNIVESFLKHIKHNRHVKNNTAAAYVNVFINTAKIHACE